MYFCLDILRHVLIESFRLLDWNTILASMSELVAGGRQTLFVSKMVRTVLHL
jgi:hypothetical protein